MDFFKRIFRSGKINGYEIGKVIDFDKKIKEEGSLEEKNNWTYIKYFWFSVFSFGLLIPFITLGIYIINSLIDKDVNIFLLGIIGFGIVLVYLFIPYYISYKGKNIMPVSKPSFRLLCLIVYYCCKFLIIFVLILFLCFVGMLIYYK